MTDPAVPSKTPRRPGPGAQPGPASTAVVRPDGQTPASKRASAGARPAAQTIEVAATPVPSAVPMKAPEPEPERIVAPTAAAEAIATMAPAASAIETMTDQAGAVAAEAVEPAAEAARATIEAVEETVPKAKAALEASPFFDLMKGMTMATAFDTTKAKEMFGGMNEKAKGAMEKGAKLAEDLQEFTKGNVEALVASGRVAAKGVEEMAQYSADYGRKTVEQATTAMKSFAGIKSPTELFQLQSEYAKSAMDSMVAETSKFTESYIKLLGDIAQPLTSRYAVAAEKIKAVAA